MNRKGPFFLIRVIVLFGLFFVFSNSVSAADRYWVGGTATWDSTAGSKWSTTSGGTGDQAVPTAADDVYFDAASGANTITLSSSSLGRSINFTGFTGTISHPSATTLTIGDATAGAGSIALKMVAGMTYTLSSVTTSALSFVSTSATQQTITAGGKTFGNVTINSTSNGDYAFTDAITLGSTATLTLTKGTLHTDGIADNSGLSHSWGLFNSNNSNTRTLSLGASSITITGGTGSAVAMNTTTGLTLNAGSSTVTLSGASQTFRVGDSAGGGKTWNNVVFSGSGTAAMNTGSIIFANLTRTGTAVKTDIFQLQADNGSVTVTGTLTLNGNSSTNRILVQTSTLGTSRTFTITGATVSASNVDFRDITFSVSTDLSAVTGLSGDAGGNSGITFTPSTSQNLTMSTAQSWSTAAIWTSRVPLPQDNVTTTGWTGGNLTSDMPRLGKTIDTSGTSGRTLLLNSTGNTVYGSLDLTGVSFLTSNQTFTFEGRGSFNFRSNGNSINGTVNISMVGGALTLQDNYVNGGTTTVLNNGTFDANDFNVSSLGWSSSNSNTRAISMGNGTWTMTGSGGRWTMTTLTGLTFNAEGSTIAYNPSSAGTFNGGGLTYNNVTFTPTSGAQTIAGSNTFNTLTVSAGKTLTLTAGTTQTVSSFVATGSSGNVITINSSTGASAATLSDSSGINTLQHCSIQDITATGGATWRGELSTCSNVSGNTGWNFVELVDPTVSSFSPADNQTAISTMPILVITFDEAVDAETGNITIKKASDDSTVETIDVTGSKVTGSGTTQIVINPSATFNELTNYYVLVDATAFDDVNSNSFAGISSASTWNFTTRAEPTETPPSSGNTILGSAGPGAVSFAPSVFSPLAPPPTPSNPSSSAPSSSTSFTRNLTVNSTGNDVLALQKYLNAQGFTLASSGPGSPGNETTTFGPRTYTALIKFQKARNITPPAGFFGPITRGVVGEEK